MKSTFSFLTIAFALLSCKQQDQKYDKRYLDMDSLISQQLSVLQKANTTVSKKATMGGNETSGEVKGDSAALARELDIFRQMDIINKPLFRDQYQIATTPDAKSNLTVQAFTPKIKSPIAFIRFYYLSEPKNLKKIEARYEEENSLYYTRRDYTLEFGERNNIPVLIQSTVRGTQKMILSDSVSFSVNSEYKASH